MVVAPHQAVAVSGDWNHPSASLAMSRAGAINTSEYAGSERNAGRSCEPIPTMVLPLPVMKTALKLLPLSVCSRCLSSSSSGSLRIDACHDIRV